MLDYEQKKSSPKDIIASIEKATSLLMLYKDSSIEELSIKEISQMLEIPKTTAFRIVSTLVMSDFLEQNPENSKYKLGINVYILGNRYLSIHTLEKVGHSYLEKVVKEFGESVSISIMDKMESVVIDKLDGVHSIRVVGQIGKRNPLHCSGSGKVFLGCMEPEERRNIIQAISPLKVFTPYTITDPDKLFENVSLVRKLGYIYDDEEIHLGQICISAPIYNCFNKVCAAMTVSGPKERIIEKGIDNIGRYLMKSCNKMSREMGCTLNLDFTK